MSAKRRCVNEFAGRRDIRGANTEVDDARCKLKSVYPEAVVSDCDFRI